MRMNKIAKILLTVLIFALLTFCMLAGCKTSGTEFIYGKGEPSAEIGKNGDYYLNTDDDTVYCKTDGVWQTVTKQYKNTEILLPTNLYACVGQPLEIYFRNIIAYSLDDVLIRTGTDMPNCKQLTDKWIGTPQKEGFYTLEISLYSKNLRLVASKRVFIIAKKPTATSATVLAIGDSTLYSGEETFKLLDMARKDNVNLTLLGTMSNGEDNRYEGRPGWKASHYANSQEIDGKSNPFYNPVSEKFDFAYYMSAQSYGKVDAVFLQLGINDIFHAMEDNLTESVERFISDMKTIVDSVHNYDANVKVVINMIFPCCQNQDKFGSVYGVKTVWEYMRNMYSADVALLNSFQSANDNTYVSFANAVLDVDKYQTNDVHPSPEGYHQLGEQMYYTIRSLIN